MDDFKKTTESFLFDNNERYVGDIFPMETGTIVLRVNHDSNWTYETYRDWNKLIIPFLFD